MQNGAAQGRWKLADFWQFSTFSAFYKNWVNWPSSGSEIWMHNIISMIFGKKYFRKNVKWWCSKLKTIKNLNLSRLVILKIQKSNFLKLDTICICQSYLLELPLVLDRQNLPICTKRKTHSKTFHRSKVVPIMCN